MSSVAKTVHDENSLGLSSPLKERLAPRSDNRSDFGKSDKTCSNSSSGKDSIVVGVTGAEEAGHEEVDRGPAKGQVCL